MTAIVTDAHYRMSVSLIRDLGARGVRVVACEKEGFARPVGFASRFVSRCVRLPEEESLDALFALCREIFEQEGERPALLPVGAKTLAALAENKERFSAVCGLCAASPEKLTLLNDKAAVAALSGKLGVPVPANFEPQPEEDLAAFFSRVPLPCAVKPHCGEAFGLPAAARYRIARTKKELQDAYKHFLSLTQQAPIVQEYLPGAAYGCSVLAEDGRVVRALCHRRVREYPVTGGPSSCCECVDFPVLRSYAETIIRAAGFTGPAMLEFKCGADGAPRLLEINPRVWGTFPLTRASGSDFSHAWYCLAGGLPLPAEEKARPVKMAYYPADFAAALGYLRAGKPGAFFAALRNFFDPRVKSGLFCAKDPKPSFVYVQNLFHRRRHS